MEKQNLRHILTRLSLAVVLIGIGLWEAIRPAYWSMYFPSFITSLGYADTLIMAHGIVLTIIGLAVLLGAYLRISSALAILVMLSVVIALMVGFGFTDIVLRDIAILIIAIALFFDDTRYLRLTKS